MKWYPTLGNCFLQESNVPLVGEQFHMKGTHLPQWAFLHAKPPQRTTDGNVMDGLLEARQKMQLWKIIPHRIFPPRKLVPHCCKSLPAVENISLCSPIVFGSHVLEPISTCTKYAEVSVFQYFGLGGVRGC